MDSKLTKDSKQNKAKKCNNKSKLVTNNKKQRDETELDEAYKFNPDDIVLKWPILHKIESKELTIVNNQYRSKFEEQNAKLNDPRKIFFHIFKPNLKI